MDGDDDKQEMEERGDGQNIISTTGKGVEILEKSFEVKNMPLIPMYIHIFKLKHKPRNKYTHIKRDQ